MNFGTIINNGTLIVNGMLDNSFVTASNCGTLENNGKLINIGAINNCSTIVNNGVYAGIPLTGNPMTGEGEVISASTETVTLITHEVTSATPAIIIVPSTGGATVEPVKVKLPGVMSVDFPRGALTDGVTSMVVVTESASTSDVGGKVYSINISGVAASTTLTITLPASSANSAVHYVVGGVSQGMMQVVSSTSDSVTFQTTHNSEYAVVSIPAKDPSNRTNYNVTISSGVGYIVNNRTGSSTQEGSFVFNVVPIEGYEVKDVRASNGTIVSNGFEYTLSNVTADTTIHVVTAEAAKDTSDDKTTEYLVIGAAVGTIIILSLAAVLLFGKKS